jgi:hypothetical protein
MTTVREASNSASNRTSEISTCEDCAFLPGCPDLCPTAHPGRPDQVSGWRNRVWKRPIPSANLSTGYFKRA